LDLNGEDDDFLEEALHNYVSIDESQHCPEEVMGESLDFELAELLNSVMSSSSSSIPSTTPASSSTLYDEDPLDFLSFLDSQDASISTSSSGQRASSISTSSSGQSTSSSSSSSSSSSILSASPPTDNDGFVLEGLNPQSPQTPMSKQRLIRPLQTYQQHPSQLPENMAMMPRGADLVREFDHYQTPPRPPPAEVPVLNIDAPRPKRQRLDPMQEEIRKMKHEERGEEIYRLRQQVAALQQQQDAVSGDQAKAIIKLIRKTDT